MRITRFDDRQAFRRCVEFLARLYPEREPEEFEVGLARTPCTLSHDAAEAAADALRKALERRGAHITLIPSDLVSSGKIAAVTSTQELSPEIDLSFLDKTRMKQTKSGRFVPVEGKAPWEES